MERRNERISKFMVAAQLSTALLGFAACGEASDEAPGGAGVGLDFRAVRPAASQGLAGDELGAGLTVTDEEGTVYTLVSTKVNLRDIELDLPRGVRCNEIAAELAGGARCGSDNDGADDSGSDDSGSDDSGNGGGDKIKIDGPFLVDLLAGTSTPSLDAVRVPALDYDRIDFRIEPSDGGELAGASWVTEATFTRDGAPASLALSLRFNEDLRVERPGGVQVDPSAPLLVRFDVTGWLSGVGLAECVASGEADAAGGVVIDDRTDGGACGDVEGAIKEAVKRSMQLDRDDLSDDSSGDDDGTDDQGSGD